MPSGNYRGDCVRARRNALELSQAGLADLIGVSRGTIRNIETGMVEPNRSTWSGLERTLGWAPGSGNRIAGGFPPVEVLPAEVLKPLLHAAWAGNQGIGFDSAPIDEDQIKTLMGSATEEGLLDQDRFTELTDLVMELHIDEDEANELLDLIPSRIIGPRQARRFRDAGGDVASVAPGDLVHHDEFGEGKVLAVEDKGDRKKAHVDFGGEHGRKALFIWYSPMEKIPKEKRVDAQESATAPAERHPIPVDVRKAVQRGQVIDYDIIDPQGSDNLSVVTLLVKKSEGRLSREDRRYIADVWSTVEDSLHSKESQSGTPNPTTPRTRINDPREPSHAERSKRGQVRVDPDDPPF